MKRRRIPFSAVLRAENDFTHARIVEVIISSDGNRLWVDVDGVNRLRVYHIQQIVIKDRRQSNDIA